MVSLKRKFFSRSRRITLKLHEGFKINSRDIYAMVETLDMVYFISSVLTVSLENTWHIVLITQ